MEEAHQHLIFGNVKQAIECYSKLIEGNPNNGNLHLCRAIANLEIAAYDQAIKDLESSDKFMPNTCQVHFRWGIALFYKEQFPQALTSFRVAESLAKAEHEKVAVNAWIQKCLREQGNMSAAALNATAMMPPSSGSSSSPVVAEAPKAPTTAPVPPVPSASSAPSAPSAPVTAAAPPSGPAGTTGAPLDKMKRIEYDWYQNAENTFMVLKIKGQTKESCKIALDALTVEVSIQKEEGQTYECGYTLFQEIIPEQSTYTVNSMNIELKLKKKTASQWAFLEKVEQREGERANYPSSSKKKVDWDKLDRQIGIETQKEQPEGDEAMNKLLKAIYEYCFLTSFFL